MDGQNILDFDAVFAPLAQTFLTFAAEFNLTVGRGSVDAVSWYFSFQHPKGGIGRIEVCRDGEHEVNVHAYWWLDDYEQGTRFCRRSQSGPQSVDKLQTPALLRRTLSSMVSWPSDSWNETVTGLGESWKRNFTKEEFAHLSAKYSILKYYPREMR